MLRRTREAGQPPGQPQGTVKQDPSGGVARCGELEIDTIGHEVRLRGKPLRLTPTEFRILDVLVSSPGETFTRATLLERVKRDDLPINDRTLDRHIANLRHKIETNPAKPRYILTVFGIRQAENGRMRESTELIVIGSHGRGGLARAFLGSVAEGVLRRTVIPVLIARTSNASG